MLSATGGSELPVWALSVRQPWAWLIVQGFKDVENRSWWTRFRGLFYVHASQGMTKAEYMDCWDFCRGRFPEVRLPAAVDLPRGGIVGRARLADCVTACPSGWFVGPHGFLVREGKPLPFERCKGALGFFKPSLEVGRA